MSNPLAGANAKQQSVMQSLVSEINRVLGNIEDRQSNMYNSLGRLRNPRPSAVGTDASKVPSQDTIESDLQQILARAERIYGVATDQADDLNSTV